MATNRNIKAVYKSETDEVAALKARIAELENSATNTVTEAPVRSDEYIRVMSLLPHPLNLSTRDGGQGSVKRFGRFGEIKRILYKDLVDILDTNQRFAEAGYFYILNPEVVRQHGLDDVYEKILTKNKIEEILSMKSVDVAELYSSANDSQKRNNH